jgi:UDP-N-acetylmuramate--alanine ligase
MPKMRRVEQIHFTGIGGAGMCGIAEVLHNEGYRITGSDQSESRVITRLRSLGIEVFKDHHKENIQGANVIVRSTAIHDDNPEIVAASQAAIPVIPRAAMLAELMRFRHGIAIAGTHGKTTTTSLVSSILAEGGLDPSFVIGGKLNSCGSNAQLGHSNYFVVEADESDASFLFLKPMMAVVTNIDADHMETYHDDLEQLHTTFVEFLHHLPFYGPAIVCLDDEGVRKIIPRIERPVLTYGFHESSQYRATSWSQVGLQSEFTVLRPEPHKPLTIQSKCPGRHNVLNALAAIVVATELSVKDEAILGALFRFEGVGRRFQMIGSRQFNQGIVQVIDDYGHHPKEIQATIEAFRAVWPNKRLIHVFQPHRYSRTKALFSQFIDVLKLADEVLLFDIYAAGENVLPGVSSAALASEVKHIRLVNESNFIKQLEMIVNDGDMILMQGAGNIGQLALNLVDKV